MTRLLLMALTLVACTEPVRTGSAVDGQRRIVSLDLCADLHVLAFADHDEIAALSPDARSADFKLRELASRFPTVRPSAEDVLLLNPDLVVRSFGGGPRAGALLERAGVEVVELGWPSNLDAVLSNADRIRQRLGRRMDTLPAPDTPPAAPAGGEQARASVLYLTPSGVTTGPGSLIHEMLEASGARNLMTRPGWYSLPLEDLVLRKPDHLVTAFFDSDRRFQGHWDSLRHPIARQLMETVPRTDLPGALVSCPAWPLFEAAARIAEDLP